MKEASTAIAKKYFGFGGGSLLLPRYPDYNVVIEYAHFVLVLCVCLFVRCFLFAFD
jgi:hypothetical protein